MVAFQILPFKWFQLTCAARYTTGYTAMSGVAFNDARLNKLPSLVTNVYGGGSVNRNAERVGRV